MVLFVIDDFDYQILRLLLPNLLPYLVLLIFSRGRYIS